MKCPPITKKKIKSIIAFYQAMDYNPLGSEFRRLIARDIMQEIKNGEDDKP